MVVDEARVTYEDILYAEAGGVARITINRENRGNAFRRQTLEELTAAFIHAGQAPGVRVVVLTAAGKRFFCTGGDVRDYMERYGDDMTAMREYERVMERCFSEMIHCQRPIVMRINGDVVGGANAFHLAADLAVMSTSAKLQQVGVMVGSVAGFGPTQWWPGAVGDKRAREIIMCCRPVPAQLALEWGAVNAIAAPEELDAAVQGYTDTLKRAFPEAMRYSKVSLNAAKEQAFREMTQAREWLTLHFPSMESREGFGAFVQKRAVDNEPSWERVGSGHVTVAPYGGFSLTCGACGAAALPEQHTFCGVCGTKLAGRPR
ncbi:MAG: 1,4-dihydroxy-2-naphthoyl-CoA synthase [Candidatus Velthaea sp.]